MLPFYPYAGLPGLHEHKLWAEIDTQSLTYNYKHLCALTPGVRHICVVKADAYGHISDICVRVLLSAGCSFFAVSCIEEALTVRRICEDEGKKADILILGYTDCNQAPILSENNIIQTVLSAEYANKLSSVLAEHHCNLRLHIALDTGMNRIGLCARNENECALTAALISKLMETPYFKVEGLFTHFARAEDDPRYTEKQFALFSTVKERLAQNNIRLFCHVCNSCAAIRFPQYALDGVRFGILLYGVDPAPHIHGGTKPVMSLHTLISHIHDLPTGQQVSYGGCFESDRDRRIATLPIGYADGFLRTFSGYTVTVHTKCGSYPAPVIGRICMDQCMIDVTNIPAEPEDRVTIFGENPKQLSDLARLADTIEYEVVCLISARVPRIKK